MDFSKSKYQSTKVKSVNELVRTLKIDLQGNVPTLFVKIFKSDDGYYAIQNYWIGTNTISPYIYNHENHASEEDALNEILSRGLMHFDPNLEIHKIKLNDHFYEDLEEVKNYSK